MANIIISRTADLDHEGKTEFLSGTLFASENQAHTFSIGATRNKADIALSGAVTGYFIRPDGSTVSLSGTIEDGRACVTLPQACYVQSGRFRLTIFVTDDGVKTAVYSMTGNVAKTTTDVIVDPGNVIPDVDDIIAEYATMQQAVEDCEDAAEAANTAASAADAAAASVAGAIADAYSATSTYAVGDYCTKDGKLYRCTAAISTAEAWTESHWTEVQTMEEVGDLKSEFDTQMPLNFVIENKDVYYDTGNGTGTRVTASGWGYLCINHIPKDTKFHLHLYNSGSGRGLAWRWRNADGTWGAYASKITGEVDTVITATADDCSLYCNTLTTGGFISTVSVFAVAEHNLADVQSILYGGAFTERLWEVGSINGNTGINQSGSSRIRCQKFYATKGTAITVDASGYNYYVYEYNLLTDAYKKVMNDYATYGSTFIVDEDCYVRVVMSIDGSSESITTGGIPPIIAHLSINSYGVIKRVKENTDRINSPVYYQRVSPALGLEAGKSIDSEGQDDRNTNRARTANYIDGQNKITASINTGYSFVVVHYYNDTVEYATSWVTAYESDNPTGTYRFIVKNSSGSTFTDQDVIDCGLTIETTLASDNLETFLAKKVDVKQPDKVGKFLYVDSDGDITGVNLSIDPTAPVHVRVGTYNIGHYSEGQQTPAGTTENAINFRKTIADMGVSLLGTNENDEHFDAAGTMTPRDMVFANWKYYNMGPLQEYSCNGFASDYAILNVGKIEFTSTTRYCWYCDMDIGGKNVHVVSAHLDFRDITQRRAQIAKVIEHCADYARCIIMGDFNPANYTNGAYNDDGNNQTVWETDYAMWTSEGYKLANDGYLGTFPTVVSSSSAWIGIPCDNIIVTPNIEIRDVGIITKDYMHDHKPIWADLVIY